MKWWLASAALVLALHELAIRVMSKYDIVSCLLAPGPHLPLGWLMFAAGFIVLRVAVVVLTPALAVLALYRVVNSSMPTSMPGPFGRGSPSKS